MSTTEIWLLCIFIYPALWVIFSSVMSLITFVDFKILRPNTLKGDKFGLKGSIQFWWMIPGFAPFYLFNLIFQKPLTYFSNKREKKKQDLFYGDLIGKIKKLKPNEEFSEKYKDFEFCIFRKPEYYIIGVYKGSCKRVEVFQPLDLAIEMVELTKRIKYGDLTFAEFEQRVNTLAKFDRLLDNPFSEKDIQTAKDIIENEIIEKLKRSVP